MVAALAAELVGFVAAWAGFALASLYMAEASGRRARWPHFVAAWNFTNVVQYAALLAAALLGLGLPASLGSGLALAAVGYALWLEWFVARAALGLPPIRAAGFVVVDLVIGLFVSGLVARLS